MAQFNLLEFQKSTVEELLFTLTSVWGSSNRQIPLILKSPTGSGKTFMMAHFIKGLNHLPNWDVDKAFVWITFSDELAMQSKEKFFRYFENTLENELLTVQDINSRGVLMKNDILFINWQKVVSKSAESRVLRRPEDELMQKESGKYFEDLIDATYETNREIVLIVDESHKNSRTKLAQEIIDYINPKVIVKVSATPEEEPTISQVKNNEAGYVEVSRQKVVDEGLIKEKIVVQTDEDLQKFKGQDLDEVLIDLAINKRFEIVDQYKKIKKEINPLILIQLPNDDRKLIEIGQKTKEQVVLELLIKKGIKEDKIAMWFDGKQKNMEFVTENDSDVDFMLFKQAAGTGWDCPRAHILIMFREISSPTFYTQTIGRILRMPNPENSEDYKDFSDLRTGYLYTNYKRTEVTIPDQSSFNKPLVYIAKRKKHISNIQIESAFVTRVDYGDLSNSSKFQMIFLKSMNEYFGITNNDIFGKAEEKLIKKGIELNPILTNKIVVNAEFSDFDQINLEFASAGEDVELEMSHQDIEKTFNYLCFEILKEQTEKDAKITNIARSWSPLKSAIRVWFKGVFKDNSSYYYKVFIYDVLKRESSVFRQAITKSLKDYRPILQVLVKEKLQKIEKEETPIFTIQDEYAYTDDFEELEQKLCVLEKYYIRKVYDGRQNEEKFMSYLDSKDGVIDWWFKNGDNGRVYLAIRYFNTAKQLEALFYPDWVIMLKDGRIGIFDTKSGRTATDTEGRAEALAKKLKLLGKNYIGGIAIFENGTWYYNDKEDYQYTIGNLNGWKKMEDLFTK